jgi:hypothetical protein
VTQNCEYILFYFVDKDPVTFSSAVEATQQQKKKKKKTHKKNRIFDIFAIFFPGALTNISWKL